jgi:hypothetical protein
VGLGDAVLAIGRRHAAAARRRRRDAAGRPAARRAGRRAGAPRARRRTARRGTRAGGANRGRCATARPWRSSPTWARPAEGREGRELGAEVVGLLRTEFLFLDRAQLPARTSRPRRCARSPRRADGRPLVVRTLDAGRRQAAARAADAARGQPIPRRAGHPPDAAAPRCPRHAAAGDPARRRRASGQGDAARWSPRSRRSAPLTRARRGARRTGIEAPLELGIMVEVPGRGADRGAPRRARGLLLGGHQRPHAVHDGRERGDERLAGCSPGRSPRSCASSPPRRGGVRARALGRGVRRARR